MSDLAIFCRMLRQRSAEHRQAIQGLHNSALYGQVVTILRQELDSMIRVIYLLSITDLIQRIAMVQAAVEGRPWVHHGTKKRITDREMADLADKLHNWTNSVYKFGCAFIHLSSFHDYHNRDPMGMISVDERQAILDHMRYYHGGPQDPCPGFREVLPYLPMVFEKIADNLECYIAELEKGG